MKMKMNKKYFFALLTTLAIQLMLGISLSSAVPCEDVIEQNFEYNGTYDDIGKVHEFAWWRGSGALIVKFTSIEDAKNKMYEYAKEYVDYFKGDMAACHEATTRISKEGYKIRACMSKTLANNNCDPTVFKKDGVSPQSKSKNSKSNQISASQANSPEAYNLQVSQTDKQNYYAMQQAYNQSNAGKGKKHNSNAEVPACLQANADQTYYKNSCKQTINFSYCFVGAMQDSADKQLLKDLSCHNAQFANTSLSSGEELAGNYLGLTISGMVCKSPSQPLDMHFNSAEDRALGRCSF